MGGRAPITRKTLAVLTASALVLSLCPLGALGADARSNDGSASTYSQLWNDYFAPVDQAQEMLEAHEWVAAVGSASDKAAFNAWFERELEALQLPAHTRIDRTSLEYAAPVDGTAAQPAGAAGHFTIKVSVYRTVLDAFASRSVVVEGIILPMAYEAPEPPATEPDDEKTDLSTTPGTETPSAETPSTEPKPPTGQEQETDPVDPPKTEEPEPVPPVEAKPEDPPLHPLIPAEPLTQEEAVEQTQQTVEALVSNDPTVWNIPAQMLQEIAFEEDEQAADSIETWLQGRFEALDLIPEGFVGEIRDMVIEPPTETEWGSFECLLYLVEEDVAPQSILSGSDELAGHPLNEATRATMVFAIAGQGDGSLISDDDQAIPISGAIPPLKVKAPTEVDADTGGTDEANGTDGATDAEEPGEGDGADRRIIMTHPLAFSGTDGDVDVINSEEELEGENAPRPVKRPSGEKVSSMSSTTIQRGAAIAPTSDPMGAVTVGAVSLACISCAVVLILISMRRVRRSDDEA